MKVYTKRGDKGATQLASGKDVEKSDPRIEAYGTVDELNATIGLLKERILTAPRATSPTWDQGKLKASLETIQSNLFTLGSVVAGYEALRAQLSHLDEHTLGLENQIDQWEKELPRLTNFVLPGGNELGALAHLARTVCRRAERRIVALGDAQTGSEILRYINRLSDFFFVLGRYLVTSFNGEEIKWKAPR
ncbi:MAG: cob(I)yrinic acid a,c-diamide adenosyltransferase [Oligoflexales bacterium]